MNDIQDKEFKNVYHRSDIPVFNELKRFLKEEYNGKIASGGTQVIIRCPYCGDSRDYHDAHLYIGPSKRDNSICYHCFLCGRGGNIDLEFFRQLQCYNTQIISMVIDYNMKARNNPTNYDLYEIQRNKPIIRAHRRDKTVKTPEEKLAYINNRLGVQLTFEDLERLKIILNLERYLRDNHIRGISRKREVLDELTNKHIGFLSIDNTYVVMRAIVDPKTLDRTIQMRYVNYALYPIKRFYAFTYYAIPANIDTSKEIHFHVAEGAFDILGVYFNCDRSKRTGNEIFAAAGGKTNYQGLMRYFFRFLLLPVSMCTLDLYLDRNDDGSIDFEQQKPFINLMKSICKRVTLHVNMYPGEKDFGVPANRIDDYIIPY